MNTSSPVIDDDYVVKLPSGDARIMSLDELDAALDAGTIHKDSLVLAPGTVTWTTLGVLAGLDDEIATPPPVAPSSPSSIAPMVLGSCDSHDTSSRRSLSSGRELEVDLSIDIDDDAAAFAPRRRAGKIVGAVFAALAIFAVGFAIKAAVSQAIATSAGEAALAAMPPPAPAPVPPPAPRPAPVVESAPPPPAPSAAPAPATSKTATGKDKDKKKGKLPGAPTPKKK